MISICMLAARAQKSLRRWHIIYWLYLDLNSEWLFLLSYSFRTLLSEKHVQTCGINWIYLILSITVLYKTGKIWVMCGTMHFSMN